MDATIFKAYDIRAIYPDQMDENDIYQIGRAFIDFLKVKEVAIGWDMRVSTPSLLPHLIAGINDAGAKVIKLGQIGTEVLYFTVGKNNYESGIMLTASHNPSEYNGMKMVKKGAEPISGDNGIYEIRDLAINSKYERLNLPTQVEEIDPFPEFRQRVEQLVDITKLKPIKIVIDAGNGMGGVLVEKVFSGSNLNVIPMYFEPDGRFPNHEANPIKEENVAELRKRVVEEKADLGIALDGDGDRIFFIDEHGGYTLGYFLVAILAKKILEKYPSSKIVYENRLTWAIEDTVSKCGGTYIICKPGHSFLKSKMREIDAVFSGETSSHFYYKDIYYADSSMLTIALLLELLTQENTTLAKLLAPYSEKYFISGEINFTVDNADTTIEKVKQYFVSQGYEIDELDGITTGRERDWRFSLRKSNTEPLVRLNVEAKSQEIVDQKTKEISDLITS